MSRGLVYVVNTAKYLDEALAAWSASRAAIGEIPVCIVAPRALFSDIGGIQWAELQGVYDSPIVKLEAYNAPFDDCIFIDSDTQIIGDISSIFEVLESFDLAAAHEPTRGWDYQTSAPHAFCELNTGVLGFRKSPKVEALFHRWRETYDAMRLQQGLLNDQPAFREALWHARDVRLATLPSEFHFVTGKPNYICWSAAVLHGRNDLNAVAAQINSADGPRVLHPDFGLLAGNVGKVSKLRQIAAFNMRALSSFLPGHPRERVSPGDWSKRAEAAQKKT